MIGAVRAAHEYMNNVIHFCYSISMKAIKGEPRRAYKFQHVEGSLSFWFLDKDLNNLENTLKHAYAHELSFFMLIEQMSKLNEKVQWVMVFVMIN